MNSYVRHALSTLASAAIVLGFIIVGSAPAHAAVGVDLQVSDTTITAGESVDLTWSSTDAVTLVATADWSGAKAIPNGSESVTPDAVGTFTYTLTATDAGQVTATDSVTVTVEEESKEITPKPVTFPDECTVVIPETSHVTYFVEFADGEQFELDGAWSGDYFFDDGDSVTFFAEADEGFTLTGVTSWDYTASAECTGPTLVTTEVACGEITFTNVVDSTVYVEYGSPYGDDVDGGFELAAGDSNTVKTAHEAVWITADDGEKGPMQLDFLEMPTGCAGGAVGGDSDGTEHPTVAPDAGAIDGGVGSNLLLVGLAAVAVVGAARHLHAARI